MKCAKQKRCKICISRSLHILGDLVLVWAMHCTTGWANCGTELCSILKLHRFFLEQAMATFGMGVHFCLGYPLYMMEAKVLLALIARGYDVANVSGPVYWGASPSVGFGGRTQEVLLRFTPRQQQ